MRLQKTKNLFFFSQITLSLFLGAGVYLYCADIPAVRGLLRLFGLTQTPWNPVFPKILRYYCCDVLFAYALTLATVWIIGHDEKSLKQSAKICILFEAAAEFLQKAGIFPGTFDPFDILTEIIATGLALFCIIHHFYKKKRSNSP